LRAKAQRGQSGAEVASVLFRGGVADAVSADVRAILAKVEAAAAARARQGTAAKVPSLGAKVPSLGAGLGVAGGEPLSVEEIVRLFESRGADFRAVRHLHTPSQVARCHNIFLPDRVTGPALLRCTAKATRRRGSGARGRRL
jgi:hypothetical protein